MAAESPLVGFTAYFLINGDPRVGPPGPTISYGGNILNSGVSFCPVAINYITEGAANVIWSFQPTIPHEAIPFQLRPAVQDRLLRLRKGTRSDSATTTGPHPPPFIPSAEVYDHFASQIVPLFAADQLVKQEKIYISENIIVRCNFILDSIEEDDIRPVKRWGWHIEHGERAGLLITSMYPTSDSCVLFHLKPKWLAQSPTAPPNARRCRTCALQVQRGTSTAHSVCPLALSSADVMTVHAQIAKLALHDILIQAPDMLNPQFNASLAQSPQNRKLHHEFSEDDFKHIIPGLVKIFSPGGEALPLLQQLRTLQLKLDPKGVHGLFERTEHVTADFEITSTLSPGMFTTQEEIDDLSMAMTLRDTTMFVKLTRVGSSVSNVEVRLADLDPKSGDDAGRVKKWWKDEDCLIREGWYTGEEILFPGQQQHTACLLWNRAGK